MIVEADMTTLNRLLNVDNECVGYFTDDDAGRAAMQAARAEWNAHGLASATGGRPVMCRSVATPINPFELEDVEPGDGDRVDYVLRNDCDGIVPTSLRIRGWHRRGAVNINTQRHEINRYRRPGKSNRSADLGGPEQAAGVLYVLIIKAPK